ncbi:MAG TPA: hypothetical protein PLR44_10705 [Thermomicrobiales bacterium]|jgi:hypothetical protein|nr:hypothetical protein [Thermomicrobiales bacterium]
MLTNTASDQGSREFMCTDGCPYPAALIAGVAGEGDARPRGHLHITVIWGMAVTCGTSQFRDECIVLTGSSAKGPRRVSDQPASLLKPVVYTRCVAACQVADRLIADGHAVGIARHVSCLTGMGGKGFTMLDADAPSTQRHSRAARLPPWRCVLGLTVASQTQRYRREGGGECSRHAALRPDGDDMLPDGYSATL